VSQPHAPALDARGRPRATPSSRISWTVATTSPLSSNEAWRRSCAAGTEASRPVPRPRARCAHHHRASTIPRAPLGSPRSGRAHRRGAARPRQYERAWARGSHMGAEGLDGGARVAIIQRPRQPQHFFEAMNGLTAHQSQARSQREGVARNGVWQAERRGHRNLERRAAWIGTVAVISPRERDLVAAIPEGVGDALRARPRSTHPRAGNHGNDENLHVSRVRRSRHGASTHRC